MSSNMVMGIVSWLSILGIPSIFTMTMWCIQKCQKYTKQIIILMRAQKAQMRSQLLDQYHKYINRGWVSEDELEDWENQYKAYHELAGDNGVLDARREKLLILPTEEEKGM